MRTPSPGSGTGATAPITGADNGETLNTSMYTPVTGDVRSKLRARAMYDDDEDEDKTAQEDSANSVRRAPETNTDPVFPDQNLNTDGVQTEQTREVAENTRTGTNLGARIAARDPGDVLTYSISGADAVSFDINRATGQLTTKAALDYEDENIRESTVTVTATDPFGATVMSVVTITVTDVNEDPTVMGAASIDHAENGTVLDIDAEDSVVQPAVYTSTDEDGDDDADTGLTWLLSGADASKFDITTTGDMRTLSFKANPDYESPGDSSRNNVYEVTVKVTDSEGNSDEQDVTVKVTNVEEPGTVTLSTLQPRVDFPVTATLADPDNITAGSVSWQWYKGNVTQQGLETLDGLECVDANTNDCFIKGAASATYTPVVNDVVDTLVAVALYTDGSPNEDDAKDFAMMVTAQSVLADTRNKAPVFPDQDDEMEGEQTDQERMILENTPSGQDIGNPVIAMDSITANNGVMTDETLTYTLGGPDAASFSIDRRLGQLQTKAELNKETKDTYIVTVTATDPSGEIATAMVTIKVGDADEPPMIMVGGLAISGPSSLDYAENGADAVGSYTASGPDAAGARIWLTGDDDGDFNINGGELIFRSSPDFENPTDADENNVYSVTVNANDGTNDASTDVTVTVTNVDELGTLTGEPSISYMENGMGAVETYTASGPDADMATWSREGDDAGVFSINNDGMLSFNASPDYEAATDADTDNAYEVTVKAAAGGEMETMAVTVTVTNEDEDGTVSLTTTRPVLGTAITASVSDLDLVDVDSVTWQWASSSDGMDPWTDISGATDASYTPEMADSGNYLQATASYTDGHGSGKTEMAATDGAVSSNSAPEFDAATAERSVAENTAAGENVGAPVMATDADTGDTLAYTLGGADAASFDIDAMSGQITVGAGTTLDYETKQTYSVTVTATDGDGRHGHHRRDHHGEQCEHRERYRRPVRRGRQWDDQPLGGHRGREGLLHRPNRYQGRRDRGNHPLPRIPG